MEAGNEMATASLFSIGRAVELEISGSCQILEWEDVILRIELSGC